MKLTVGGKEIDCTDKWNFETGDFKISNEKIFYPDEKTKKTHKIWKRTIHGYFDTSKIVSMIKIYIDDKTYYQFKGEWDLESMIIRPLSEPRKKRDR